MSLVQLRTTPVDPRISGRPLVDRQARTVRYLRVSLTDRCNYRCTYCMPEAGLEYGPRSEVLSLEEVVRLCAVFAGLGVRRVRLTGGEPTLRRGLVELVAQLTAIPTAGTPTGRLQVVMTTNGERLAGLAAPLAAAGLGPVTVSLDSLDPARFTRITRRGDLRAVIAGIEAAQAVGLGPVKLNTVVVAGFNDDELPTIVRWAWERELVPRFIELMPMSGGGLFAPGELMPAAQIRARVAEGLGIELHADDGAGVRGAGPATYWRADRGPFAGRRVGTIAAMTENFCADCNRLRVSATGQLHACLARDDTGNLRAALRSTDPDRLEAVVRAELGTKRDAHGFNIDGSGGPIKAMVSIGG